MNYLSKEYKEYIKSPRWKLFCKRAYGKYGRRCQACGSFKNLNVHHRTYDRFGRELLTDVSVVCSVCHRDIHARHRANRNISLAFITDKYIRDKRKTKCLPP